MLGSTKVNALADVACLAKLPLNTSILPLWKSAAYRYQAPAFAATARPVYWAPPASVYTVTPCIRSTPGDQPESIPPSPSKMNNDTPVLAPSVTVKSVALGL